MLSRVLPPLQVMVSLDNIKSPIINLDHRLNGEPQVMLPQGGGVKGQSLCRAPHSQNDKKDTSYHVSVSQIELKNQKDDLELEDNKELVDEPEDLTKQTALHNRYSFWFHRRGQQLNKGGSYEESTVKLSSFQTIEHFWRIYDHIIRPNDVKVSTDYHLFKEGIKPTWEDIANKNGGKWMVRIKKGLSSLYWEELVLAIIGEQFDVGYEICGAVISVRTDNDIISVWNKNADNVEATNKIRDQLRRILKLPAAVAIEYKKHQESLTDNSSYRNPSLVWRAADNDTSQQQSRNYIRNPNSSSAYGRTSAITAPSPRQPSSIIDSSQPKEAVKSSRWDALAPSKDSQDPNKPHSPRWRPPPASTTVGDSGTTTAKPWSQNAWKSANTVSTESSQITIDREHGGLESSDVKDSVIEPSQNSSKNIGVWVKSQLAKGQTETGAPNESDSGTISAPAWRPRKPNPESTTEKSSTPWNRAIR